MERNLINNIELSFVIYKNMKKMINIYLTVIKLELLIILLLKTYLLSYIIALFKPIL